MQNPIQAFLLRPRLLGAIVFAVVLSVALPFASLWTRLLVGWCVGVVVYTALVIWRTSSLSRDALRQEASRLDDSAPVISLFAILAGLASCGAVAMLVIGGREPDAPRLAHLALAIMTMLCAWVFVQVIFTVHYAHLYYGEVDEGLNRGGIDFPGGEEPDFWDFLLLRHHRGDLTDLRYRHHQQGVPPDRDGTDRLRLPVQHQRPGSGGEHGRGLRPAVNLEGGQAPFTRVTTRSPSSVAVRTIVWP